MNLKYLKWAITLCLLVIFADVSFAQRKTKRRQKQPQTNNTNYFGTDTSKNNTNQPAAPATGNSANYFGGTPAPAGNIRQDSLPITVVKNGNNGLLDSTKPSLRNDAAIELNLIKDRTPLEYENIREDDAVYRVRVWREIDTREKINLPFRYAAVEDNGSPRFLSILLLAIKSGQVPAFSGDDDRFTTPITPDVAINAFGSGNDTSRTIDKDGNLAGYTVRARVTDPDSIYKFRIKEEWIFDKETSRLYVRILGIAPIMPVKLSNGLVLEGTEHPLWWVYYPDIRNTLAKYEVYNPKNFGARMTWEDLFESRMFSSYIIKSTLDNPYDQTLANKYPNNSLFRLLEGEKIKDKIFDYEQSLWSY